MCVNCECLCVRDPGGDSLESLQGFLRYHSGTLNPSPTVYRGYYRTLREAMRTCTHGPDPLLPRSECEQTFVFYLDFFSKKKKNESSLYPTTCNVQVRYKLLVMYSSRQWVDDAPEGAVVREVLLGKPWNGLGLGFRHVVRSRSQLQRTERRDTPAVRPRPLTLLQFELPSHRKVVESTMPVPL